MVRTREQPCKQRDREVGPDLIPPGLRDCRGRAQLVAGVTFRRASSGIVSRCGSSKADPDQLTSG